MWSKGFSLVSIAAGQSPLPATSETTDNAVWSSSFPSPSHKEHKQALFHLLSHPWGSCEPSSTSEEAMM